MGFEIVTRTHVGRRRKINEDALLSRPDLGVWAIADGMGGHRGGDVASRLVVQGLADGVGGPDLATRADAAVRVLAEVNAQLFAMGGSGPGRQTIGATVVAVIADARAYRCLWAGDSRVYLARAGELIQLSHDHSLVQQLVDSGDLDPEEAASHPNANVITRAVGAGKSLTLDSVDGDIAAGDGFLLASDGLTRLVSDQEMMRALAAADLAAAADDLIETCLERGAPDNISFVILRGPAS